MMGEQDVEMIDYLNLMWKRKGLIIGGTLVAAVTALLVSLSMPKTYEISRTLKIGRLPRPVPSEMFVQGNLLDEQLIEDRDAVINRVKDHRVLKMVIDKMHLGLTPKEMEGLISIDTKTNPGVRYTVRAHNAQGVTRIADLLADFIIKTHEPIFRRVMRLLEEYEVELTARIRSVERENRSLKSILEKQIENSNLDPTRLALLEANIGQRERDLGDLRKELKEVRFSRLRVENTSVIAADALPQQPVTPKLGLNVVLGGTLGLMGFTFLVFFLEHFENARSKMKSLTDKK